MNPLFGLHNLLEKQFAQRHMLLCFSVCLWMIAAHRDMLKRSHLGQLLHDRIHKLTSLVRCCLPRHAQITDDREDLRGGLERFPALQRAQRTV